MVDIVCNIVLHNGLLFSNQRCKHSKQTPLRHSHGQSLFFRKQIQCNPYLFIYNLKVFWTYLKELKIVGLKSCNLILNKLVHYASIWVFLRFSSRILKFIWASQQLSHQAVFCVFLKPANCLLKIKKNEGQLLIIVYSLKRIVNNFQIIFKTR